MICSEVKTKLPDYVLSGLSLETRSAISDHLAACKDCAEEVRQLQHLSVVLDKVYLPAPPQVYWDTLLSRIHERIDRRSTEWFPQWVPTFGLPVAAALVVVIAIAIILPANVGNDVQELSSVIRQLPVSEFEHIADLQTVNEIDQGMEPAGDPAMISPIDKELLREIVSQDGRIDLSSETEPVSRIENLTGKEAEQVAAALEKGGTID